MKRKNCFTIDDDGPPKKRIKHLVINYNSKYRLRSMSRRDAAACILARFWRTAKRFEPTNNTVSDRGCRGFVRKNCRNVLCPITQDEIPLQDAVKFVHRSGHVTAYSRRDIIGYFKSTANFNDPLTREEWSRWQVLRLYRDSLAAGDPCAMQLMQVYHLRFDIMNEQIERGNRVLAIENSCGIAMTDCLDLCGNFDVSTATAAHHLVNYLIPEWKQLVDDYARFSIVDCKTMLYGDRDKMRRLERSGIHDPHELMHLVKAAIVQKIRQIDSYTGERAELNAALDQIRVRLQRSMQVGFYSAPPVFVQFAPLFDGSSNI